ncbi:AraC family transcriptional regulator [Chryseolinea lacunae]|uniref:Helix-turn-helix domain-containing protein n=1 Tax=Chryseolinea lacunae TaxID=2801331 RepID=A0ABS1KLV8_9BACT|nr:AraC family transcriptional regulator [Chryseolinea lacunae]MBL0740441.1 helix-turn-helix domain-containing protein [Chryseolinea lacunae]
MQTENLYAPFDMEYVEVKECPIVEHRHTFFELVYVLDGTGVQSINKNKMPFGPDKMFLLMPQDTHAFEITKVSKFFFIRFTDVYLKNQNKEWLQRLEFIFQNNSHLPGCILKNKPDKMLVRALVEGLIREQVNQKELHRELVQQLVNTLITIVARNLALMLPEIKPLQTQQRLSQEMVNYVHQHIYLPESLKAEKIADRFNVAPTYISEYFKKLTGQSLQQYIIVYKLKLAEIRLQYSDMRMNEIAAELNFTDESHLNRMFKKHRGKSPSEFRRGVLKARA